MFESAMRISVGWRLCFFETDETVEGGLVNWKSLSVLSRLINELNFILGGGGERGSVFLR